MARERSMKWLFQPLQVGHALPKTPHKQDSTLAAIALLLMLVGLGIAMNLANVIGLNRIYDVNATALSRLSHAPEPDVDNTSKEENSARPEPVPLWFMHVVYSLIMSLDIFLIMYILYHRQQFFKLDNNSKRGVHRDPRFTSVAKQLRPCLSLIGISVFYGLGLFSDIIRVFANIEVMLTNDNDPLHRITDTIFHISRLFFLTLVTRLTFLLHSSQPEEKQRNRVCFSLVLILAGVGIIWFDSSFRSITDELVKTGYFKNSCNRKIEISQTPLNNSSDPRPDKCKCQEWTDSLVCMYEGTRHMFYSYNIEHMLLAMEIIVGFFIRMSRSTSQRRKDNTPEIPKTLRNSLALGAGNDRLERDRSTEHEHLRDADQFDCLNIQVEENAGLSESNPGVFQRRQPEREVVEPVGKKLEPCESPRCVSSSPTSKKASFSFMTLGLLVSPVLSAMFILTSAFSLMHENGNDFCRFLGMSYAVVYYIICISVVFLAYKGSETTKDRKLRKYNAGRIERKSGFNGMELMVLFCTLGAYIWNFLSMFAFVAAANHPNFIQNHDGNKDARTSLIIIAIIQYSVHTLFLALESVFLFHAIQVTWSNTYFLINKKSTPAHEGERASTTPSKHFQSLKAARKMRVFLESVLFLSISNFTFWVVASFIKTTEAFESQTTYQAYFYGSDAVRYIYPALTPFIVFYNFNAFFITLGVYLKQ